VRSIETFVTSLFYRNDEKGSLLQFNPPN